MALLKIQTPNPKQLMVMQSTKKKIGYGGARGGGKSWLVRSKSKLLAFTYPGIKMLIVRRTYPELVSNHILQLRTELYEVAKYNDRDKMFTFINGSTLFFRYCSSDKDLDNFQGQEYDIIFFDEATQLSEHQMKVIEACLRGVNDFPKRIYYTCNPGGQGHAYIKRLFIDKQYREGENPDDFEFVQALVTDNEVLMNAQPEYVEQLKSLPPALREAWLNGRWDIFEGQFFEDFRDNSEGYETRQWTHVIEPFEVPRGWNIYRSFDWGFGRPFSVGWWAVDYDGRLYRIMELYGCQKDTDGTDRPNEGIKWTSEKIFRTVAEIERTHRWLKGKEILGIADPSIWESSRGESIYDQAVIEGVYFTKGDNSRIPGWMQLRFRFQFDEDGYPMMYVFKNCKSFIRTIPTLCYSERNPEDLDTDGEDHIADETRYMCMSRPITPVRETPAQTLMEDPLELLPKNRRYESRTLVG